MFFLNKIILFWKDQHMDISEFYLYVLISIYQTLIIIRTSNISSYH